MKNEKGLAIPISHWQLFVSLRVRKRKKSEWVFSVIFFNRFGNKNEASINYEMFANPVDDNCCCNYFGIVTGFGAS